MFLPEFQSTNISETSNVKGFFFSYIKIPVKSCIITEIIMFLPEFQSTNTSEIVKFQQKVKKNVEIFSNLLE